MNSANRKASLFISKRETKKAALVTLPKNIEPSGLSFKGGQRRSAGREPSGIIISQTCGRGYAPQVCPISWRRECRGRSALTFFR